MSSLDWTERLATAEDLERWKAPPTAFEREEALRLWRWFMRRYPTFGERADYIRRKWREAELLRGAALPRTGGE